MVTKTAPPPEADLSGLVVSFADSVRAEGLTVPPDATLALAAAIDAVGVASRLGLYWAGRATLVRRPEDVDAYDRAFDAVFGDGAPPGEVPTALVEPEPVRLVVDDDDAEPATPGANAQEAEGPVVALRWSDREVLARKDLAVCSPAELRQLDRMIDALRFSGSRQPSRRFLPSEGHRGPIDLGRTARASMATDGEAVRLARRERGTRLRRVVLLVDVSGSMEPYARALVRFAHAAVVGRGRVEVFTLGTRLTRLTRQLASRDPDVALASAAAEVQDWSGGTRLGESVARFVQEWGVRGLARGATVVVLSDGWDRGDPQVLAGALGRLGRVAHRLVWVNPLKATPGYAPLARGMAAALPLLDDFVEGHSLHALEDLAEVLAR